MNNNNKTDDKTDDIIRRERERESFGAKKFVFFYREKKEIGWLISSRIASAPFFSFFLCNVILLNWVQIVFYFFCV